jgi:16S rRNA (guanine527-N7)-methyltransferase
MPPYFSLIPKYFHDLSSKQLERFKVLWHFYQHWNAQINVISRKDIDELYLRHVLHSLAIAKCFRLKPGTKVLDVGTGGGFPGIPLSIYFEDVNFTLVDSIGKKVRIVEEVIKQLELENVRAVCSRVENLDFRADVVVSRAVTAMPSFLSLVAGKINLGNASGIGNGIVYLKGGDFAAEVDQLGVPYTTYSIRSFFDEPFFESKKVIHIESEAIRRLSKT